MAEDSSVVAELLGVFDLPPKSGETPAQYAHRLAATANSEQHVSADDWEGLSDATQRWVNNALEAIENKKEIPLPSGIEGVGLAVSDGEQSQETAVATSKKKSVSKKAPAKKAAAKAAPAKKAAAKPEAAKAPKTGASPGRKGKFALTDKITLTTKENPFRAGTKCANWWAKIKSGVTVAEAIGNGVPRHHIRWEQTLGHAKIG